MAELTRDLDRLVSTGHPLPLLEFASTVLAGIEPRRESPFESSAPTDAPPLPELLSAFAAAGPASGALAWTVAQLVDDALVRARVVAETSRHSVSWPAWLQQIDQVEVLGAAQILDPLRDNTDLIVHVRVAGFDLTAVVLVDFNLGTVVKDAFITTETPDSFRALWASHSVPSDGTTIEPLALADARAQIEQAVETGAITWPPLESDSWPASRPLLNWLLRHLPAGGTAFVRPDWSDADRENLLDRLLGDQSGAALDRPDDRSIVDDLLWYRTDYGYGDPLRWSPAAVEILLLDWYPRKIIVGQPYLRRMPAVLRAFVSFGHREAGLTAEQTEMTLAAIDALEDEYRTLISQPRRQGPAALLEAIGVVEPPDLAEFRLEMVADHVGGREASAALDDEPLPDEPFDWTAVPPDLHHRVAEVLALCDDCCAHFFDTEHRTAVRRLLQDAVSGKPRAFGGRGSAVTAAASLCWLVARANESAVYPGVVPTRVLMSHFGLATTPSTRITTMRQAVGADRCFSPGSLGSARYLTSGERHYLIEARDS